MAAWMLVKKHPDLQTTGAADAELATARHAAATLPTTNIHKGRLIVALQAEFPPRWGCARLYGFFSRRRVDDRTPPHRAESAALIRNLLQFARFRGFVYCGSPPFRAMLWSGSGMHRQQGGCCGDGMSPSS